MADDLSPSGESDQTQPPVGEPPKDPVDQGGGDKVAYESYKKLLSEKRKIQTELEKFRSESEKRHEQELQSQAKYKELWESSKQEADQLKEKLSGHEERWNDAIKLNAFHDALGEAKKIDPKYAGFIDTGKILIDPETGRVDPLSAKKEVDRIMGEYPEIIKSTVTNHLPNTSPSSTALKYEDWLKLPAAEMRKRYKEVKGL